MFQFGHYIWQDLIFFGKIPVLESADEMAIASCLEKSAAEKEGFYKALVQGIFTLKDPDKLKTVVETHQTFVCLLLNTAYDLQQGHEQDTVLNDVYDKVIADLQSCLDLLRHLAPCYFDVKTFAPKPMQASLWTGFETDGERFKTVWAGAEPSVLAAFLLSCDKLKEGPLSFQQISFLEALFADLERKRKESPFLLDSQLVPILLTWNFNEVSWLQYLYELSISRLTPLETNDEKREWLRLQYKSVHQLPEKPGAALHPENPSAKDQLLNWLQQELEYVAVAGEKKDIPQEKVTKINTSVSVPVLALLTRLLKDAGVITTTNLQELFRFMSTHYTTQRKESIAHSHFHSKYYAIDESTKRKVADLLLQMVQLARKIS